MLPREWQLRVVDTNVEPLKDQDLFWADCVMISAMIVHQVSVRKIVARCAALGNRIGALKIACRGGQNHTIDATALDL